MADYRKRVDPPAQYKNMLGDRSEKPMSVQMAEVGVEFTPVGTIFGLNDIKEELQKEEPDYYKIGMMAGVEAIGLIPGLDKVAIEAIKAGAKRVGLDKVADQTDALLSKPKAEDSVKTEIIAGPGAKSYSDASLLRAGRLEAAGASPAQIEAETGRVKTGTPDDYLDNKPKTLADISSEYKNLVGIRDHLQGLIKQISTENSSSATSEIARYERELSEINEKIAKFERANPADESGIVVKPQNPFKFEIDDSRIEIKNSDGAQTLKESTKHYPIIVRNIIPTHTELFNEYPNLEYVEFYVDPDLGSGAHFNPTISRQGAIVVGPKYPGLGSPNSKKFRQMFFHELQHATQHQDFKIAGLEQLGGSPIGYGQISVRPDEFYKGKKALEFLEQNPNLVRLRDEILEIFEAQKGTGALDAKSPGLKLPGTTPNPNKIFGDADVAKKIARKMRELEAELFKVYMKTTSETEARLVGRRAQDIVTVGSGPKPRVTSDLAKERRIETKEEYLTDTPKSDADKKKQDIKLKLGTMTNEEVLRYATGAINFARYAKGIDKELQGFDSFGPTKPKFAKGGAVNNMSMKQQMSLFEYGGIADDGMTKDPVSGNNIPPGSLAKEVRDDIPAMLSEGEYVVPADVLRYYGVNFFENLRGQAKQGLQSMEQNGRIGGTPMTQQDVARNMQQPMMAPAPIQAAQGAMMQSPMRIQQQPAPQAMGNAMPQQQPIMANQGTMVQGFNDGPMPQAAQYRSGWSPARARYNTQMFQGTSSQQANIAAAQEAAQEQAATEEITQFRPHYNQAGESVQVKYVGTTQENMRIAEGQDDIISKYPLTEQEYNAYKAEMSRGSGGGDGGDTDPTPTGSDTSWMDGIDWSDKQSVKDWVESDNGLGMSSAARNIAGMGGITGGVPQVVQAQDIAKVRGVRDYYDSIGDEDMVKYLDGELKEAMKETGLLTSALDKLGLMTGKTYLNQMMDLDPVVPDNVPGFQARVARQKAKVAENAEAQKAIDDAAAEAALKAAQANQDDDDPFAIFDVQIDRDPMGQGTMTTSYEGIDPGLTTASFEEDPEIDFGVNKGGLMTAPKPKKKTRKYNKGGLAGKKK